MFLQISKSCVIATSVIRSIFPKGVAPSRATGNFEDHKFPVLFWKIAV